jgi:hypothetical protein
MSETADAAAVESVANVLDRELKPLIADWLGRVESGAGPNPHPAQP